MFFTSVNFKMETIVERVARWSDRPTRQALGFDIEKCIKLKFPPNKVEKVSCVIPPYRISKSDVLTRDTTRWLVSLHATRDTGLHVQRNWEGDAYSINDIRYTHYYTYDTGRIRVWADEGVFEWVSTAHRRPQASDS